MAVVRGGADIAGIDESQAEVLEVITPLQGHLAHEKLRPPPGTTIGP